MAYRGKNRPLQLSNLRKPFTSSVASSGMKDTPTYRMFLVPPKAVIKSYPSHRRRLWTKSLSATYLAAGGLNFYILCREACKYHCSKQVLGALGRPEPSAHSSVLRLWP